jgi:hypothetical protein
MAPPRCLSRREALVDWPFPELIAAYIYDRNQRRDQQSKELRLMAHQMEMQALLAGVKPNHAKEFVRHLVKAADRMERPEGEPVFIPIPQEQMPFLRPGKAPPQATDGTAVPDR